jgi:hypothetical protein
MADQRDADHIRLDYTKSETMKPEIKSEGGNGMLCQEFDGLLSDALDGVLTGVRLDRFRAHARVCSGCGPMFAEVEAGRSWLKEVAEVEPPASLLRNVLASTTGVESQLAWRTTAAAQTGFGWWERAQAALQPIVEAVWGTVRQPRFAMSFGMAFFSLSVALSMLGVKASDLRQVSLRPAAIRHTYYNTQARVVRYYDNIKLVYEVQAAVRELKRNVAPVEPRPEQSAPEKKDHKNDTTQQPEQKQERNYSQTEDRVVLAGAPLGATESELPVAQVKADRRIA